MRSRRRFGFWFSMFGALGVAAYVGLDLRDSSGGATVLTLAHAGAALSVPSAAPVAAPRSPSASSVARSPAASAAVTAPLSAAATAPLSAAATAPLSAAATATELSDPGVTSSPEAARQLAAAVSSLGARPSPAALFAVERVIDDFPGSIEAGSARARLAAIAAGAVRSAAQLRAGRKLWEARNALSIAYFATMDRAERDALGAELEATNEALLEARRSVGEIVSVRVKPGDSLSAIAKRKGVSWRLVKRLSGLRSTVIRIGQKLKTLEGRVAIEVSKKRFELVLTIDGHFLRHWMIATGKDDRTPVAAFKITERIIEPTWYSPDGVYPFGHEKNILGTRWLGFERTEELAGFGIHGTRYPESVGTAASMGCLRMRNADVEELFDYIPQGCAVTIRP